MRSVPVACVIALLLVATACGSSDKEDPSAEAATPSPPVFWEVSEGRAAIEQLFNVVLCSGVAIPLYRLPPLHAHSFPHEEVEWVSREESVRTVANLACSDVRVRGRLAEFPTTVEPDPPDWHRCCRPARRASPDPESTVVPPEWYLIDVSNGRPVSGWTYLGRACDRLQKVKILEVNEYEEYTETGTFDLVDLYGYPLICGASAGALASLWASVAEIPVAAPEAIATDGLPDLAAEDIAPYIPGPGSPCDGGVPQAQHGSVLIKNIGTAATPDVVEVVAWGELFVLNLTRGLEPGEEFPLGDRPGEVIVDPENLIEESDETNNTGFGKEGYTPKGLVCR